MKAIELITALQGLIEKHGDNIKVNIRVWEDFDWVLDGEYIATDLKVEETYDIEGNSWIQISGKEV